MKHADITVITQIKVVEKNKTYLFQGLEDML